ncbi:alpha-mannosidase [Enterococcus asini]|uniref:alpha-mannosidase n=1 Tax=Enterococcus asini TaxID=57732 RepID=UPI000E4E5D0B|nr:glycoside hydrolase family 38 C-terminal domain-containing protein [Enterococcus asini]RGW12366.1 alpha-mannosidase [Enterococcus asini]
MIHPELLQVLKILSERCFIRKTKIENYSVKKVDYFDWKKTDSGVFSTLEEGIGGLDSHHEVYFSLDPEEVKLHKNGQIPCIIVTTDDHDIWNTNNPQFIVKLNGELVRALDMNHNYFLLECGKKKYDFDMNVYTNTPKNNVFIETWFGYKNEAVYKLYYQLKSLSDVLEVSNEYEERVWEIYHLIDKAIAEIDLIHPDTESFYESIKSSIGVIDDWFEKNDSESSEKVIEHVVGHTHIDISWLWTLRQTREKVVRSFLNAVYLMKKNPQMTFMSSSPLLYEIIADESPELFEQIKKYIVEERWEIEGAMYIESDLNLPSGESLVRQILYGKDYIRNEFGVESTILWLPDCFGFTASLPQILVKTGVTSFFTSKMDWNEVNKIPNDTFTWKGIDGSSVLTQFLTTSDYSVDNSKGTTYNGRLNASQIKGTWSRYRNKKISNHILQLYGFGDGGGGPTDEMIEFGKTFAHRISTMPLIKNSQPSVYFEQLHQDVLQKKIPQWSGELYLETHRGVLTTDGRLKRKNREIEELLHQTDFILALEFFLTRKVNDGELWSIRNAWKKTLINHFHDIITGTSIKSVHDEAMQRYLETEEICNEIITDGLQKLFSSQYDNIDEKLHSKEIVVVNPGPFKNDYLLSINDEEFLVESVPALGYKVLNHTDLKLSTCTRNSVFFVDELSWTIRTPYYELQINEFGEFINLIDTELGITFFDKDPGNQLIFYPDRPEDFDAWNIDSSSLELGVNECTQAKIRLISQSKFKLILEVEKNIGQSFINQQIIFYSYSKRIDIKNKVDWQESGNLLKVKFPTPIKVGKANYGIQFGSVERPVHNNTSWEQAKFEVCGHKWADFSEEAFGLALLSPDKYGFMIEEQTLYLSLLRSTNYPAPDIDKGEHCFTYAILPHTGDFRQGNVYHEAYDLSNSMFSFGIEREPLFLDKQFSLPYFEDENVICETVKVSENGNSIILRCYESFGRTTKSHLITNESVTKVNEVSILEENISDDNGISVGEGTYFIFSPYEIKTIEIGLSD